MMWVDYTINSGPNGFTVMGDWPGEVMGFDEEGNPNAKSQPLYQPGDIFVVDDRGWLMRVSRDDLEKI